jgi:hypothetical protein
VKAISLWQPWASLIAIGAKRIETRSWPCNYVGPLAIHAAKRMNGELQVIARDFPFGPVLREAGLSPRDLPLGCIVAVCRITGCKPTDEVHPSDQERAFGDYAPGRFAWILEDIQRLSVPEPCKGHQGFFDWDATRSGISAAGEVSLFTGGVR